MATAAAMAVDALAADIRTATGTTQQLEDMADPLITITPAVNMLLGRHDRRGLSAAPYILLFLFILISSTCRKSVAAQVAAQVSHLLRPVTQVLSATT